MNEEEFEQIYTVKGTMNFVNEKMNEKLKNLVLEYDCKIISVKIERDLKFTVILGFIGSTEAYLGNIVFMDRTSKK